MSTNTDWDVDYYKTDYESEEHWELRRSFMTAHKDKFDEDELVCLAQVFTNVEFMGCRYPEETMRRVGMLSQEVAAEFRKSRAKKLKRTFVGAQDAAGAKAKGRRTATHDTPHSKLSDGSSHSRAGVEFVGFSRGDQLAGTMTINIQEERRVCEVPASSRPAVSQLDLAPNRFKNLVILDNIPNQSNLQVLHLSASKNKSKITCKVVQEGGQFVCSILLDGAQIAQVAHGTQTDAKSLAADLALSTLQQDCYTIKKCGAAPKINITGKGRERDAMTESKDGEGAASPKSEESANKLTVLNKGFKMMQAMGWQGGALGSTCEGRVEPVTATLKVGRKGLGLSDAVTDVKINQKFFKRYLKAYAADDTNVHELVFAADYTKEERAVLHNIASSLQLKSGSKNTPDGGRYLTISKKIPPNVMAKDILNGGIYAQQFELVAPTNGRR